MSSNGKCHIHKHVYTVLNRCLGPCNVLDTQTHIVCSHTTMLKLPPSVTISAHVIFTLHWLIQLIHSTSTSIHTCFSMILPSFHSSTSNSNLIWTASIPYNHTQKITLRPSSNRCNSLITNIEESRSRNQWSHLSNIVSDPYKKAPLCYKTHHVHTNET